MEVFWDKIMSMADVGAGGEEAIVTFDGIAILTPRGRYSIELHLSFLRLEGQANNFKIQYSSVVRVFCLTNHIPLSIRKRQILYPHIVMQGLMHEVCIAILRGLSSAKVTRFGKFHSSPNGYAVKSSLKAEDGVLYSFEKRFFFLPKPPTLLLYDEIDYLEFERHTAGGSTMHYFDLLVGLKTEQEHLFRKILRNDCKGPNIMNLGDVRTADGVAAVLQNNDDDAVDPHLERTRNESVGHESDEEDEDFVVDKDDGGSPTDVLY
ncbi:FACT complex subunit SSRP1 [Olea europaea subsp. europaea]|uniref:FACT complex subunit SSRP1 n=1 Tax=Olea europaea subsp. europaea TaxID=158383 RepID=A0A8S0TKD5_OLEEU|nr:FACT complex subunit SSRP1 [Olea europaea subsp. europaea]